MKKLLLIATTTTALATSIASFAYADADCGPMPKKRHHKVHKPCETPVVAAPCETPMEPCGEANRYYGVIEGGVSFFDRVKSKFSFNSGVNQPRFKLKSKTSGIFGVGVGYNFFEQFATDLVFDYITNPRFSRTANYNGFPLREHIKANIWALMARATFRFFDMGCAQFVGGAGIGVSQIREKPHVTYQGVRLASPGSKRATQFAYQLFLGAESKISDGIVGGLFYRWSDYGRSKARTVIDPTYQSLRYGKHRYKAHSVIASLRFDM